MVKLVDVSKYYNSNGVITAALKHINLSFNKGDIVAITGESGSGKSTLLNVICANDSYEDGEIYFKGEETSYFDLADKDNFRNNYVGFIYQNYNIIDSYTVLENVMAPLLIKGLTYQDAKKKALELIEKVGLTKWVKHRGTKLSGGQKQRVVIARALAKDPEILACDEPTGNLDSNTAKEIISLIKEVAKDKLVLIVTHNYEQVKNIVTRKVTLLDGEVIEDKVIKEVDSDENQKMVLTSQKLSFKNLLYFVKNNILSTPKKTLFLFFILFISSFLILTMFQNINYNFGHISRSSNDSVITTSDKYLIIQNSDKTALDMDELLSVNSNIKAYNNVTNVGIEDDLLGYFYYLNFKPDYLYLIGEKPTRSGECNIIFSNKSNVDYYKNMISNGEILGQKVVGVAYADVRKTSIVTYDDLSLKVLNDYAISDLLNATFSNYEGLTIKSEENINCQKVTLAIPPSYLDYGDITFTTSSHFKVDIDYDIVYDSTILTPIIYLPVDFGYDDLGVYEASLYSSDASKVKDKLEDLGYFVYRPSDNLEANSAEKVIVFVFTILLMIPVILIYFISYILLRIVYTSKFKDFAILRDIGVLKKDMHKILFLEVIIEVIFTSLLTFILSIILGLKVVLYSYINAYIVLVFIFIMLIFALLLAYQINRRLYKETNAKALKAGEINA